MDEDGGVPPRMIDVDESLHEAYRRLARAQSGDDQREAAAGLRSRQVAGVTAMMQIQERMRLAWPEGLAVPAEAPLTAWPYRLGDPDRYTHSWTAGNGYSWAQHADGAFLAAAYAPPRSGACQVDSEAGIGIQHHATRDGRVVVRPRLSVQSRFGWVAHPDTTEAVVVDTQLDTWLYVGAYALDPSSLRWAIDPANPWWYNSSSLVRVTSPATPSFGLSVCAGGAMSGEVCSGIINANNGTRYGRTPVFTAQFGGSTGGAGNMDSGGPIYTYYSSSTGTYVRPVGLISSGDVMAPCAGQPESPERRCFQSVHGAQITTAQSAMGYDILSSSD